MCRHLHGTQPGYASIVSSRAAKPSDVLSADGRKGTAAWRTLTLVWAAAERDWQPKTTFGSEVEGLLVETIFGSKHLRSYFRQPVFGPTTFMVLQVRPAAQAFLDRTVTFC